MERYLKEAIAEYEQGVRRGNLPYMDAELLVEILRTYEDQHRDHEAEQVMRYALRLHPDNPAVLIAKAMRLKDDSRWAEAEELLSHVDNGDEQELFFFYTERKIAQGFPDEAERDLRHRYTPDMGVNYHDALYDVAQVMLEYGYLDRASKLLEEIPETYVDAKNVHELLADAYYQREDYDQAIHHASALIDAAPFDAVSWTQLADIQQKCERFEDCINSCEYALAIDDRNTLAMSLHVYATFQCRPREEALRLCEKYTRIIPDDYSILMYWGESLMAGQTYAEARTHVRDALLHCPMDNPDRSRILNDLVLCDLALHDTESALEHAGALAQTGKTQSEALLSAVLAALDAHLNKEAAQLAECILDRPAGKKRDIRLRLALLFGQYGIYDHARTLWLRLAAADDYTPDIPDPAVYENFVRALTSLEEDEAVKKFKKLYQRCVLHSLMMKFKTDEPEQNGAADEAKTEQA